MKCWKIVTMTVVSLLSLATAAAQQSAAAPSAEWHGLGTMTVVASRGGVWTAAPECSLYALAAAADRGIKAVVCDVRQMQDKNFAVFYDRTLNRLCRNAFGDELPENKVRVDGVSVEQLKNCRFDSPDRQMRIAPSTLEEFSLYSRKMGIYPVAVMQGRKYDVRRALEILTRAADNDFIFVSGQLDDLATCSRYAPKALMLWRLPSSKKEIAKLRERDVLYELDHFDGCRGVYIDNKAWANDEFVAQLRAKGYTVMVQCSPKGLQHSDAAHLQADFVVEDVQ